MDKKNNITVEATVPLSVKRVWIYWTQPEHITQWNFASDEWHCPTAVNDLKPGGSFSWRMEARDGSMGFDYSGVYEMITDYQSIVCKLDDGRHVSVEFEENDGETRVTETFEVEDLNTLEQQQTGWQAILNNFKKYVASKR